MKKQPLPIGESDFKKIREDNSYYIDKTLFIKEVIESSFKVLLFPRPRRFGKTLNLSMIRYFFEKQDQNTDKLFNGLSIKNTELFKRHQGKHPVIYLTFKDLKDLSWDSAFIHMTALLQREFVKHEYLLDSEKLAHVDREYFQSIMRREAGPQDCADALGRLSEYLFRFFDESVIILIDEYDTPIHSGYFQGYYDEIINFMRNFLSAGMKDNAHLYKGVITGILRVARESVFLGLNNLGVFTLLDQEFNTAFGFTDEEVKKLLADYELSDQYAKVSDWYNGYLFGGEVVYNPWSVLNFTASLNKDPRPYWVNTAGTEIIDTLATRNGRELREEVGVLLEGGEIEKPVFDSIVMRDLDQRDNLLWSFLLFSGYLKCTGRAVGRNSHILKIPNREVASIYEDMIERWFAEKVESNRIEDMLHALETANILLFERMLRKVVLQVMGYHDLSGEPEKVYHALVLGMLVWLSGKYDIRSNRESGLGRYDLMLKPLDPEKKGIIIEFKQVDAEGRETPDKAMETALKQIEERAYATELEASGVKDILKLAVVFQGKELWVKPTS